jgi:uncharacterized cupin superfamily protein
MKKGFILTAMFMFVSALVFSQTAFAVRNTATWIEAVGGIRSGGNGKEYTITVTGAISVPSSPGEEITFGTVTGITVTIEGSGTLSPSGNGSLLRIGKNQMIIAKDLTLKGYVEINKEGTFHMEGKASVSGTTGRGVINSGNFTMKDNASISGNTSGGVSNYNDGNFTMQDNASVTGNKTYYNGGGVENRGNFTMQDNASVSDNTTSLDGGGVYVEAGTFTMSGGTISGNTAIGVRGNGGGVYICQNIPNGYSKKSSSFIMQGGTISGNIAGRDGGGVYEQEGTFTMNGGTISGNAARSGSGVCISQKGGVYGTFTMSDGTISGNTAREDGGGVYNGGRFTMNGGTISGNTASLGGGVRGSFTMNGGTISGNTASLGGGGVYVGSNFPKTGGTIYGEDAEQKLKNTVVGGMGHSVYDAYNRRWRNATAGQTMNPDSYGFWLNEGDLVMFPQNFQGTWKRTNFNNTLMVSGNAIKSSSRDFVWVLQRISGDKYTMKRADAANTMTLTIEQGSSYDDPLEISGDSGSGENNWNGRWRK